VEGWGTHFLASVDPLPRPDAGNLQPLPEAARSDLLEWEPNSTPADLFSKVFSQQEEVTDFVDLSAETPAIQDDRPINEYFLLREVWPGLNR
jgi:hypothetical protein